MTHTCPLQNIRLQTKCPVTTCMWNNKSVSTGCMHGNPLIHDDEFLAKSKGVEDLEEEVAKAQDRIQSVIVLEAYRVYLLGKESTVPFVMLKKLLPMMDKPYVFTADNGWTLSLLYAAVQKENWKAFKATLGRTEHKHRTTLGISVKLYKSIQRRLER